MRVQVANEKVNVTGGLNVEVTNDEANFDDGKLVVERDGAGFRVTAEGYASIETSTDSVPNSKPSYDPHYYSNWQSNGLSFSHSVRRATDKVEDMLHVDNVDDYNDEEWGIIVQKIEDIIADPDTDGRHTVYSVVGGVLKGMREGNYAGVPFAWLFKGVVEGYITPPVQYNKPLTVNNYFSSLGS